MCFVFVQNIFQRICASVIYDVTAKRTAVPSLNLTAESFETIKITDCDHWDMIIVIKSP